MSRRTHVGLGKLIDTDGFKLFLDIVKRIGSIKWRNAALFLCSDSTLFHTFQFIARRRHCFQIVLYSRESSSSSGRRLTTQIIRIVVVHWRKGSSAIFLAIVVVVVAAKKRRMKAVWIFFCRCLDMSVQCDVVVDFRSNIFRQLVKCNAIDDKRRRAVVCICRRNGANWRLHCTWNDRRCRHWRCWQWWHRRMFVFKHLAPRLANRLGAVFDRADDSIWQVISAVEFRFAMIDIVEHLHAFTLFQRLQYIIFVHQQYVARFHRQRSVSRFVLLVFLHNRHDASADATNRCTKSDACTWRYQRIRRFTAQRSIDDRFGVFAMRRRLNNVVIVGTQAVGSEWYKTALSRLHIGTYSQMRTIDVRAVAQHFGVLADDRLASCFDAVHIADVVHRVATRVTRIDAAQTEKKIKLARIAGNRHAGARLHAALGHVDLSHVFVKHHRSSAHWTAHRMVQNQVDDAIEDRQIAICRQQTTLRRCARRCNCLV